MIHTATLVYSPATKEDFECFKNNPNTRYYKSKNEFVNDYYKNVGIIVRAYISNRSQYKAYIFICRVNFKRLIEQDNRIEVYKESDCIMMQEMFNNIMNVLSLPLLHNWKAHRIDYCVNVRTPYVSDYIYLMQKGKIPHSQRKPYDKTNRNYSNKEGSIYYISKSRDNRSKKEGSYTINFYDKEDQLRKEQKTNPQITDEVIAQARGILRLEVQCNKLKLNYIKKKYKLSDKSIIEYLDSNISYDILEKAILDVVGKGNYYCKRSAIKMITQSRLQQKTKDTLIDIIKSVSRQYQSIEKVKEDFLQKGVSKESFNRYLRAFDDLQINPVTLKDGKLKYLPNIFDLFHDAFMNEICSTELELIYD